jgi:hypothetical protein
MMEEFLRALEIAAKEWQDDHVLPFLTHRLPSLFAHYTPHQTTNSIVKCLIARDESAANKQFQDALFWSWQLLLHPNLSHRLREDVSRWVRNALI